MEEAAERLLNTSSLQLRSGSTSVAAQHDRLPDDAAALNLLRKISLSHQYREIPKAPYNSLGIRSSPQSSTCQENAARRNRLLLAASSEQKRAQDFPEDMILDGSGDGAKFPVVKNAKALTGHHIHDVTVRTSISSQSQSSYGGDLTQDERMFDDPYLDDFHQASMHANALRPAKPKVQVDSDTPRYVLRMLNPKMPRVVPNTKTSLQSDSASLAEPTGDTQFHGVSVEARGVPKKDRRNTAQDALRTLGKPENHISKEKTSADGHSKGVPATKSIPASYVSVASPRCTREKFIWLTTWHSSSTEEKSEPASHMIRMEPENHPLVRPRSSSIRTARASSLKGISSHSENMLRRFSIATTTGDGGSSVAATESPISPHAKENHHDDDDSTLKPANNLPYSKPLSVEAAKSILRRMMADLGRPVDKERNLTARPVRTSKHSANNLPESMPAVKNNVPTNQSTNSSDALDLERVIVEIESVLKDALSIAQEASEKREKEEQLPQITSPGEENAVQSAEETLSGSDTTGQTKQESAYFHGEANDDYHRTLTWLHVLPEDQTATKRRKTIIKAPSHPKQIAVSIKGEPQKPELEGSKIDKPSRRGIKFENADTALQRNTRPPGLPSEDEITAPQSFVKPSVDLEQHAQVKGRSYASPSAMRKGVRENQRPVVQSRVSSFVPLSDPSVPQRKVEYNLSETEFSDGDDEEDFYITDFGGHPRVDETEHKDWYGTLASNDCNDHDPRAFGESTGATSDPFSPAQTSYAPMRIIPERVESRSKDEEDDAKNLDSNHRHHRSVRALGGLSLSRGHRRAPIARDWHSGKKRLAASAACMNTALLGFYVGIYAGQVPALQYIIVDENSHYIILGNVVFFLGLAISTAFAWPLPLLYGRKPFVLMSLALMLALQFPQAIVVSAQRTTYLAAYRAGLLLPRAIAGFVMGFANVNFLPTLLDVFGASLQSGNPHQEIMNEYDVRRHGGGMGVWVSIWTCCYIGSIGLGFLVGAVITAYLPAVWGFWLTIILTLAVLLGNVLAPEVRRSAYRRSLSETQDGSEVSRCIGRGEVMMHVYSTGPQHWYEEVHAGLVLSGRMIRQPGFAILALYQGWIYGQVVMVMILLGALASRYYMLQPQWVAMCIIAFPVGSLAAIPFQKASLFSRARHHPQRTDSATFQKRVTWSSHLVRRFLFMVSLPFAGLAYTLASGGLQIALPLPVVFSAVIGFLSNLALSECNGIIMETFDVSDLQPGMTGRPRKDIPAADRNQRTNFSSFPRILAAFAMVQTCSFIVAAIATAVGGSVERQLGAQTATAVVAGTLLLLTILLVATLTRARTVQIVPTNRAPTALLSGPGENLPVVIGQPSGRTRRISLLEMGALTRWTEIRRRNGLLGRQ